MFPGTCGEEFLSVGPKLKVSLRVMRTRAVARLWCHFLVSDQAQIWFEKMMSEVMVANARSQDLGGPWRCLIIIDAWPAAWSMAYSMVDGLQHGR